MNLKNDKKIFWIDKDINNNNTKKFQDFIEFACQLYEYEIFKITSVEKAFDLIEKNYDDFKFKLLYIVITEELCNEFFLEYNKRSSELVFLTATIIYTCKINCPNMEKNPFYGDSYLNHGKVGNSISSLVNYIKSIQCPYYLSDRISYKGELYVRNQISRDLSFAAQFTLLNSLEEMAYPILICKSINSSLIGKDELEDMQKYLIKSYPDLRHLIKPSQEKDIFIPYNILAKYYLYLYTIESNFYIDLNKDLEQGNFDKYRIYIYLLYSCLNKGLLKGYNRTKLYRGGVLSKTEFNNLMEKYEKIKNYNSKSKLSFFSKRFLSFSKKEEIANKFLEIAINNKKYEANYVKFIIEENNNNNKYCTNIDLNKFNVSEFNNEEEVLFIPFSCFEIISIEDDIYLKKEIKVIKLKYLNEYETKINVKYLELLNNKEKYEKEIDIFIKNAFNSNFSNELSKCLNVKLNQNLIQEYKNSFPLKQAGLIMTYLNKGIDNIPTSIKNFGAELIAHSILKSLALSGASIGSLFGLNKIKGEMVTWLAMLALLGVGYLGGRIMEKREEKKEEKRKEEQKKFLGNQNFYCTSFCYGYLPQKYRKSTIPSIKWINDPKCKSCSVELIIDDKYDYPAFLIINIDSKILEINEFSRNGEVFIKYRGIPENAFSAYFALYMFDQPNITINQFFNTKNLLKDGFNNVNNLISYKILEII